ncbi:hypothetical protein HDU93_005721 [Gonapodya sp. JEL0774]|nr:hypothetical protein HDU93_005721 [Gonapodya sp. JEL0774]
MTNSTQPAARNIVVAIDASVHSQTALTWTLENIVQPRRGDKLFLVTVTKIQESQLAMMGEAISASSLVPLVNPELATEQLDVMHKSAEDVGKKIIAQANKIIDSHAETLKGEGDEKVTISREMIVLDGGDPRDAILDICKDHNANLLVMGSRGLGAMKRLEIEFDALSLSSISLFMP